MSSWRCGFLLGVFLSLGTLSALAEVALAQPTPAADKKPAAADQPPLMPPAGKKSDPWNLPADALLELTPEKYRELLDEIARLKAKARTPPGKCRLLKGRVEDGYVLLTAQFEFHAERPDAVFTLACGQAKALAAQQQDGRTPMLWSDPDGFLVQVEKPGDYTVTLDLSLPLAPRAGGARGFDLDLPRSVVTTLEMDLPADARSPRLNGKDLSETTVTFKNSRLEGPLGAESKLDLTWQGAPPPGAGPLLTARGRVTVRVEDGWANTEAVLVLHPEGGPVKQWVLTAPPGYEVKVSAADPMHAQNPTRTEEAGGVRWTVLLKEPSDEDLTLTATGRAPLTGGKRGSVGPFLVRGASRQSGVVLVSAPGQEPHLLLHPHPELTLRDLTDDERRADPALTAAYDYGAAPANSPWLEVEAGSAAGVIKTQAVHVLVLSRPGADGTLTCQATTTLTASPLFGARVDHLEVQLPPECEWVPSPLPDEVRSMDVDQERVVHIKIGKEATGPVTIALGSRYTRSLPASKPGQPLSLPLPRPLLTRDGGGQIEVTAPDEEELLPPDGPDVTGKEAHKLSWRFEKYPTQAVFSWQPYRPETRVSSVIDVTLRGREAHVRQEMRFHFPRTAPTQLTLKTPPGLGGGLVVRDGGALADDPPASSATRVLKLSGAGQDQAATLEYSFPTPENAVAVPLVTADQATDGDVRVRVWSDPGRLPAPPGGDWSEQDIEEVKGVDRLPVLVLAARRADAPLTLRLGEPSGEPPAAVLVDRALYRAALRADGDWDVRASYLIRQLADAALDVQLPGPPAALELKVTLDGRDVAWQAVEESAEGGPDKHLARLRLAPALARRPAILEASYLLPPGRASGGAFRTTLQPPLLVGDLRQAPTRWLITLPADRVALAPECGAATRWTVGPRGWLLAPRVAVTNGDVERWFAGPEVASRPEEAAAPSLVCWQDAGEPLTVVYVPESAWLLICSAPLLFLGLLLFTLARRSYGGRPRAAFWFWFVAAPLVPALGAAWAFRPTILYAVAYGCEPGAAVLLVLLAVQGAMMERYRRQIVFLPTFRRARAGSSLVRANGSHRPAGEPSTIDAPPVARSNQPHP